MGKSFEIKLQSMKLNTLTDFTHSKLTPDKHKGEGTGSKSFLN